MKDALVALLVATTAFCAAGDVSVSMASATLGPTGARGRDAAVPAAAPAAEEKLASLAGTVSSLGNDYLAEANAWRAEVGAPPLVWDETISKVSQAWADHLQSRGCDMEHSTGDWTKAAYKMAGGPEEVLGENVAWACCDDPPTQTAKQVVDMWASEKKSFKYGAAGDECTTTNGGTVGHYTQLVWAKSQKMGCGMATCGDKGSVWVCNFWPAGNIEGQAPFCRANVPVGMPTCDGKEAMQGGMPCETPTGNCGFDAKCCSCGPGKEQAGLRVVSKRQAGEREVEEGKEDIVAGRNDEAAGRMRDDKSQVEEGEMEVKSGNIEIDRGRQEEDEYVRDHQLLKNVEVEGLDSENFNPVKFQAAIAESLGIPLYEVEVQAPALAHVQRSRRLLAAGSGSDEKMKIPITLKCGGVRACQAKLSQLDGQLRNGAIARALSQAFGKQIKTPTSTLAMPATPSEDERASADEPPSGVTFPDAFPNSVRHWLLIGTLSMMLGTGLVFVFTFVPSRTPPMSHVLAFLIPAVSMCAYYSMWAGVWVEFKTTDVTPRVVFWPKYVGWLLTAPLTLATISLVADAEAALLVSLAGNGVLMVLCELVGASVVAPYKYVWWVLAVAFLLIVLLILGRVLHEPNGRAARHLITLTAVTWIIYPIVWITGSEGMAGLGLAQEVAILCLLDIVSKVFFALLVCASTSIFNYGHDATVAREFSNAPAPERLQREYTKQVVSRGGDLAVGLGGNI